MAISENEANLGQQPERRVVVRRIVVDYTRGVDKQVDLRDRHSRFGTSGKIDPDVYSGGCSDSHIRQVINTIRYEGGIEDPVEAQDLLQ